MELLANFLYLSIMDGSGRNYTDEIGWSIPPCGLLTDVLLNLALIDFDREFHQVFPEFYYSRYVSEALVYKPSSKGMPFSSEIFEQDVLDLLEKLDLAGQIMSIGPGDSPLPCFNESVVSVSQEGIILIKDK